jgi:hypothetical protein
MESPDEIKEWMDSIDAAITVFPQKVISGLIVSYLPNGFSFDTNLLPCNTNDMGHSNFDIQKHIAVSTKQAVVTLFSKSWIYIPLTPKFDAGHVKFCIEVKGDGHCQFVLIKSSNYQTFITNGSAYAYPINEYTCRNTFALFPGKHIISSSSCATYDKLTWVQFLNNIDKKEPINRITSLKYELGSLSRVDTVLIGIGYSYQSVALLPCPPKKDPLWKQMDDHLPYNSICGHGVDGCEDCCCHVNLPVSKCDICHKS